MKKPEDDVEQLSSAVYHEATIMSKKTEKVLMAGCVTAILLLATGVAGVFVLLAIPGRGITIIDALATASPSAAPISSNGRGLGVMKPVDTSIMPSSSTQPKTHSKPTTSGDVDDTTFKPATPGIRAATVKYQSFLATSDIVTKTKRVRRVPIPAVVTQTVQEETEAKIKPTLLEEENFRGVATLKLTRKGKGIVEATETIADLEKIDEQTLDAMRAVLAPFKAVDSGAPQAKAPMRGPITGDEVDGKDDVLEPEPGMPTTITTKLTTTAKPTAPTKPTTSTPEERRALGIIGGQRLSAADDRSQISCGSSHAWPYRTVVSLDGSNRAFCSGTLISPDTILTAGHCVHCGNGYPGCPAGQWIDFDFVTIHPCSSADRAAEIQYEVTRMRTWKGWSVSGKYDYDMAVIKVEGSPGRIWGWKSFGYNTAMTNSWSFNMQGYPGDMAAWTMWHDYDRQCNSGDHANCRDNPSTGQIKIMNDLWPGHSGSGLYRYIPSTGSRIVYGAISYQAGCKDFGFSPAKPSEDCEYNAAARIRDWTFASICDFIDNPAVC